MSFEHAMKRFLHFDLQIFSLLLTGCSVQFKNSAQFKLHALPLFLVFMRS